MTRNLPARPHLDHLRRQAKTLLSSLERGDEEAVRTLLEHLPAAKAMTASQVRSAGFRLADAQSAIARQTGFASWPQLARHVEQLRALEGTWSFERLEVEGGTVPAAALTASRILIDGDRFRTESPEATYEGTFNIDVEADPHEIDIAFVEGPEAGNTNRGIFRLEGDRLHICLDMNGAARPRAFRTTAGSGHAFETLTRDSRERPENVRGGSPEAVAWSPSPEAISHDGFELADSATLRRLQGEWSAVQVVRDGQALPAKMLAGGSRSMSGNELKIAFGGQVMVHALVRIEEGPEPMAVDYLELGGCGGKVQKGILKWMDDGPCFCMAPAGEPRPSEFESKAGSGRTLSRWRPRT